MEVDVIMARADARVFRAEARAAKAKLETATGRLKAKNLIYLGWHTASIFAAPLLGISRGWLEGARVHTSMGKKGSTCGLARPLAIPSIHFQWRGED
jgi:hypothetical protein